VVQGTLCGSTGQDEAAGQKSLQATAKRQVPFPQELRDDADHMKMARDMIFIPAKLLLGCRQGRALQNLD